MNDPQQITVTVLLFIESENPEDTCNTLILGLDGALAAFPDSAGTIIGTDVDGWRHPTSQELESHFEEM